MNITNIPDWGDYHLVRDDGLILDGHVTHTRPDNLDNTQILVDGFPTMCEDCDDTELAAARQWRITRITATTPGVWNDGVDDYTWDGTCWHDTTGLPVTPQLNDIILGQLVREDR